MKLDSTRFAVAPSPDSGAADSLLTFLAERLQGSFDNLGCDKYGLTNPISSVQTDQNGVVVSFTFLGAATTPSSMPSTSPSATPSTAPSSMSSMTPSST